MREKEKPSTKKGRGKKVSKERREREKKREREAKEEEDRRLRRKIVSVQGKRKGSGSRKRKRSERSSVSDSSLDWEMTLRTQVRRLTEKLKDMEGSRKWNNKSNEMQYLHQVKVRQLLVEDYRDALEEHFGDWKKIPAKLESVVKKGEKEINERTKV